MLRLLRAREALLREAADALRRSREEGGRVNDQAVAVDTAIELVLNWDWDSPPGEALLPSEERSDEEYLALAVLAWQVADAAVRPADGAERRSAR